VDPPGGLKTSYVIAGWRFWQREQIALWHSRAHSPQTFAHLMIFFMAVWPQHASGELDTFSGARAVAFVSTAMPLTPVESAGARAT
jgi:hypothetical protein